MSAGPTSPRRGCSGTTGSTRSSGPGARSGVETGWWRGADVRRDYYMAETTDGERFWLFRDLAAGGWFVHGSFTAEGMLVARVVAACRCKDVAGHLHGGAVSSASNATPRRVAANGKHARAYSAPKHPLPAIRPPAVAQPDVPYAELHCRTNFSFLEGASHPHELVERGHRAGLRRPGHHRPRQRRRRRPGPRRGQGDRAQAAHRLGCPPDRRAGRCSCGPSTARGTAGSPPAHRRPAVGPEGRMPAHLRRRRRACGRSARRRLLLTGRPRRSSIEAAAATCSAIAATASPS